MANVKKIFKAVAYVFLFLLVSLCLYTFVMIDILHKDYVNVGGYTYFVVKTGSMSGTLEVNDVIIVKVGKNPKVNDIVTYMDEEGKIVTHRLIRKVGNKYITKGDVNNTEDEPFTDDKLIGVVKSVISPSFVLKLIATFLILFIFLALINFDEVFKKYIVKEDNKVTGSVPDDIFEKEKVKEDFYEFFNCPIIVFK